jgi:hypothetical protein
MLDNVVAVTVSRSVEITAQAFDRLMKLICRELESLMPPRERRANNGFVSGSSQAKEGRQRRRSLPPTSGTVYRANVFVNDCGIPAFLILHTARLPRSATGGGH